MNSTRLRNMPSETEMILNTALLKHGQAKLAEAIGVGSSEISRKLKNEAGLTFKQFADAIDFVGAKIIFEDDDIVIPVDEFKALKTLACKALRED